MSRRRYISNTNFEPVYVSITKSGTQTIPHARKMDIFLVGGGGASGGYRALNPGSGGNGGGIYVKKGIDVIPFSEITIIIGQGGNGAKTPNAVAGESGGTTTLAYNNLIYAAVGGYGGYPYSDIHPQEGHVLGGIAWNSNAAPGNNGFSNPINENDSNLYGASGASGADNHSGYYGGASGGRTGGGGSDGREGLNATFYGGGGGGGSFNTRHTYGLGGNGYQGLVIIKYY